MSLSLSHTHKYIHAHTHTLSPFYCSVCLSTGCLLAVVMVHCFIYFVCLFFTFTLLGVIINSAALPLQRNWTLCPIRSLFFSFFFWFHRRPKKPRFPQDALPNRTPQQASSHHSQQIYKTHRLQCDTLRALNHRELRTVARDESTSPPVPWVNVKKSQWGEGDQLYAKSTLLLESYNTKLCRRANRRFRARLSHRRRIRTVLTFALFSLSNCWPFHTVGFALVSFALLSFALLLGYLLLRWSCFPAARIRCLFQAAQLQETSSPWSLLRSLTENRARYVQKIEKEIRPQGREYIVGVRSSTTSGKLKPQDPIQDTVTDMGTRARKRRTFDCQRTATLPLFWERFKKTLLCQTDNLIFKLGANAQVCGLRSGRVAVDLHRHRTLPAVHYKSLLCYNFATIFW